LETTTTIDLDPIKPLIDSYITGDSPLIDLLLDVQDEYNYLPQDALNFIADEGNVPIGRLYSLATFYSAFTLTPKGRNHLKCCTGTACVVRGSRTIVTDLISELGIRPGEVTEDGAFSIEVVHCLGACALGPIVVAGEEYHGHITTPKVKELIGTLRKEDEGNA
jgi:NADH-quinone oxidoreductase subunit E